MKKYFLTMAVIAIFAIGFAASDDTSSTSSSSSSQPKQEESHEFFEPGYSYSAKYSYHIYKQNMTHDINLKIWKDGTAEIHVLWKDQYDQGENKGEVEIKKKSGSHKDVYATWYEIKRCPVMSYTMPSFYVDEKGNIYILHVNGFDSLDNIYEAIATGNCIVGKFTKNSF